MAELLSADSQGSTFVELSGDRLAQTRIVVPPIEEQRRIADHLDAETARIDALIAKRQRQIDLLEERSSAVVSALILTGDPGGRPVSAEDGFVVPPAGWRATQLRHLDCLVQTGPFGSQLHASDYIVGGWPVVNPQNLRDGEIVADPDMSIDDAKRQELERHVLREGDIVFGRRGEMGRAGLVGSGQSGWLCGTGSLLLRLRDQRLQPAYLKHLLGTAPLRSYFSLASVGSTMDNLNSEIVLGSPVLLPPVDEQQAITSAVGQELAARVRRHRLLDRQVELLRERRQALITAMVTGAASPP